MDLTPSISRAEGTSYYFPYFISLINDTITITLDMPIYGVECSQMTDYAIQQYNRREAAISRAKQQFDEYQEIEEVGEAE